MGTIACSVVKNRVDLFWAVGTIACSVVKNHVDLFWAVGTIACNVVKNRVDLFWPQNVCRRYAENSLDLSLDPN